MHRSARILLALVALVALGWSSSDGATLAMLLTSDGSGTGFAVGTHELLTAAHVVGDEDRPIVFLSGNAGASGGTGIPGRVVAIDDAGDLALVEVDATLTPWEVAPSTPALEEDLVAWGWLDREVGPIPVDGVAVGDGLVDGEEMFLFDAPVRPGFSGGPVEDAEGRIVAMTTGITRDDLAFGVRGPALRAFVADAVRLPSAGPWGTSVPVAVGVGLVAAAALANVRRSSRRAAVAAAGAVAATAVIRPPRITIRMSDLQEPQDQRSDDAGGAHG